MDIDAEVAADLSWIRGTIEVHSDAPFALVDPLAVLPEPTDELTRRRTWPGPSERGVVRFSPVGDGAWSFFAILPRRYGDVGARKHRGLFANGWWYPQPVTEEGIPLADWTVDVLLPEGMTGVLGDQVARDAIHWEGSGERASLAVIPRAVVTPIVTRTSVITGPNEMVLVTRGRPRRVLVRELTEQLPDALSDATEWSGTIVEAPLRRRLARPGLQLAYVSDRAFRLSLGLRRFHRFAVARGITEAAVDRPDPWERSLTAAGLALRYQRALRGADAKRVLRWAAWIPSIDAVLHDRTMAFVSDVLEEAHPGDPLQDDLVEVFDPHAPALAVALQLDDQLGPGTATTLADGLALGLSLERAARTADVSVELLDSWNAPYPDQDYLLEVHRDPPVVRITREVEAKAPAEAVVVVIDGERSTRILGPGPDSTVLLPPATPKRVHIDPGQHLRQRSRIGDAWPARYHLNLTGWLESIAVSEGRFDHAVAGGTAILRRAGDTHHRYFGTLFTSDQVLVGALLSYSYRLGPLLDGLTRAHRLTLTAGPSLFYEDQSDARVSLSASLSYKWSNKEWSPFPLRGHRISSSVQAGYLPTTTHRWTSASAAWSAVMSAHPRHALALRASAGIARSDLDHHLLSLGGVAGLRCLPSRLVFGEERGVAQLEYRFEALKDLSVPMLLLWGSGLQLTVGAEAGWAHDPDEDHRAVGVWVGVMGLGDLLGADQRAIRITAAWPLLYDGLELEDPGVPQLYLLWGQEF